MNKKYLNLMIIIFKMYMIENRNVVLVDDIKRKLLVVYGYSLLIRWKNGRLLMIVFVCIYIFFLLVIIIELF